MNDEERRIISQFVERIAGVAPASAGPSARPWGGSVPQSAPNLPPVDREADSLIADLFNRYPEARYRITQTAFVQEAALVEAQNRIRQLEWEVENARHQAQAAPPARSGGLFGGMFGGGSAPQRPAPMPPPPQPQYPPGYNPGMLQPQRSGSGFLGTALTTAAGVAGGMVVGNMLMNAFSHHGAGTAAAAAGAGGAEAGLAKDASPWSGDTGSTQTASPWSDPGAAAAAQGWGADGGEKSAWGAEKSDWGSQDQTPSNYDAGYDSSSDAGFSGDDGGGSDDDI